MGDRAAVIAEEQRAVDRAYLCYEQKLAKNRGLKKKSWDVTDAASGTSFIPEIPPEIRFDDDLDGQALVFRRVDTAEDAGRTYYIGRRAVHDSDGELIVVSWQTRMVKDWMRAKRDAPGEVLLRRLLNCDGRRVNDYSDEFVAERAVADPASQPVVEGQGPERLRDFLLEDLDRARDGNMRDIVETIRQDQFELVSDERQGVLVVQGGPGTGKTAVGLHRVSWLLYNEIFKGDEVLVVGPHRGFFDYISRVLPALDIHGARMVELDLLWADSARKKGRGRTADTVEAARVKSDGRMATVLRRAVHNLVRVDALARWTQRGEVRLSFEGVGLAVPTQEIASLAQSGAAELTYQARRQRFSSSVVDLLMRAYGVARPRHANDAAVRSRIARHPGVAGLTLSMWPQMTAENTLRSLLGDRETLRAAAAEVLDDEEQEAIYRPQAARVSEEQWSVADEVCLEELRALMGGEARPRRYRHIVIDEAQDLTPMQARSLARRCPSGSMTVLGDLAQATGSHPYSDWDQLAELLSGPDGWHLEELSIGYRLPDEVMTFAAPLAAKIAPSTTFPTSVRPAGGTSLRLLPTGRSELLHVAVSEAVTLAETEAGSGRSTALILPEVADLLQEVEERIAVAGEGQKRADVQVLSSSQIKGLEFDHVVVVEPAEIVREPAGLRRLYIAITRCTQSLTIVHAEPLPGVLTGAADPEQEETVTVAPTDVSPLNENEGDSEPTDAFDDFVSALEDRVRAERESQVHEGVRHLLIGELMYRARLTPATNLPTIDIACDGPAGTVLYEVLGEGGHTYERMREAVLRIMEVQYAEGESADHRFLVLPRQPAEAWAAEAVREAFGISVIWRTEDGWAGQQVDLALGKVEPEEC
jgi:DNA helicase IV